MDRWTVNYGKRKFLVKSTLSQCCKENMAMHKYQIHLAKVNTTVIVKPPCKCVISER